MTPDQAAAFIQSQSQLMASERETMLAEDRERISQGLSPANGPEEWANHSKRWEPILGYNAVTMLFQQSNYY
jgi:hypothetical protein